MLLFLSLNPCFNGRYSQSKRLAGKYLNCGVLILVLMEDTLREGCKAIIKDGSVGLNPCFNGKYAQSTIAPP